MIPGFSRREASGPLVKICGLRRAADVAAARDAGADLIGLVFAPSKRRIDAAMARTILDQTPGAPPAVGVFVNASCEWINAVAAEVGLRLAQLSGQEEPDALAGLRVPYLKAIPVRPDQSVTAHLELIERYEGAVGFVLDAPSPLGGGSGTYADWSMAAEIAQHTKRPILLAGGLTVANVRAGFLATGVQGVDVSSGVERDGWKDPALIAAFVRAARDTTHGADGYALPTAWAGHEGTFTTETVRH